MSENSVIETFTMTSGSGSEILRVEPADEHYIVNWHTGRYTLNEHTTYRIRVLIPASPTNKELGCIYVYVVNKGKDHNEVDTDEYIVLNYGELDYAFRLQQSPHSRSLKVHCTADHPSSGPTPQENHL
ncbi:hypothetical protein ES703_100037 [subsurface metagenome]